MSNWRKGGPIGTRRQPEWLIYRTRLHLWFMYVYVLIQTAWLTYVSASAVVPPTNMSFT
jgi:hypothetical protein